MRTQRLAAQVRRLAAAAREFSPYLLVELLLPGGTLIALLLWVFGNHSKQTTTAAHD